MQVAQERRRIGSGNMLQWFKPAAGARLRGGRLAAVAATAALAAAFLGGFLAHDLLLAARPAAAGSGSSQPPGEQALRRVLLARSTLNPNPQVENIYVYRTHALDERALAQVAKMRAEVPEGPQWVFTLLEDSDQFLKGTRVFGNRWAPGLNSEVPLLINETECRAASPHHSESYVSGHTSMALVGEFLRDVNFRFIWFLDWDFYCHGHHARCFTLPALDYSGLGFVGAQLFPFNNHWGRFHEMTGVINRTAMQRRWQSFFPVGRFSKRFLGMVYQDLRRSSGLLEAYVPTLCALRGCGMAALPAANLGREFGYVAGSPGHRCDITDQPDDRLYHPCKDSSDLLLGVPSQSALDAADAALY